MAMRTLPQHEGHEPGSVGTPVPCNTAVPHPATLRYALARRARSTQERRHADSSIRTKRHHHASNPRPPRPSVSTCRRSRLPPASASAPPAADISSSSSRCAVGRAAPSRLALKTAASTPRPPTRTFPRPMPAVVRVHGVRVRPSTGTAGLVFAVTVALIVARDSPHRTARVLSAHEHTDAPPADVRIPYSRNRTVAECTRAQGTASQLHIHPNRTTARHPSARPHRIDEGAQGFEG
ncbi:hypothetical protein B0H16DRAFT_1734602 [Mycena metata]|uniref:Uncharacterized protein n=1 Tax=Mycena metata TaxID=1033252 RepID=A0AAD7HUJ5_9AGAR|nr:hypothetical protein B0H16DRAFT_1734602 [Mycena metata]